MSLIDAITPLETVQELDRYIIGQTKAKRSVAIALRNRWRRQQVDAELREEITPKNILMIGPTGVGKTEIARRLANLARSPFIKVEASKFTEVGYVGRDVESIIRDLVELAIRMLRDEQQQEVEEKASRMAEERILDLLLPAATKSSYGGFAAANGANAVHLPCDGDGDGQQGGTRERFRLMLREGQLDERSVELEVLPRQQVPSMEFFSASNFEEMQANLHEAFNKFFPRRKQRQRLRVPEALEVLRKEESERLIDMDRVVEEAIRRTEESGIVFLDEIDKIASRGSGGSGPDISREGVQRDLLPLVEGTTVSTKYGMVKTDHILFIASGAFHLSKPSDLVPELQGRFPIRVELQALNEEDFYRILTEPRNALTRQYTALLATEEIELIFEDEAIKELARLAVEVNRKTEDIGARRLATVMERLLEQISFDAPDHAGSRFVVDASHVRKQLEEIAGDEDLSRFIPVPCPLSPGIDTTAPCISNFCA